MLESHGNSNEKKFDKDDKFTQRRCVGIEYLNMKKLNIISTWFKKYEQ